MKTTNKVETCLQDLAFSCGSTLVSLWSLGPASPPQPSKCKRDNKKTVSEFANYD